MSRFTKVISSPRFNIVLFVIAAALLLFSVVGGTQAALNFYSDTYWARLMSSDIGVTLLENGNKVAYRNYNTNDTWDYLTYPEGSDEDPAATATLLEGRFSDQNKMVAGQYYDEELRAQNTGFINQYVRVTLTKYFEDADGNKITAETYARDENGNIKRDQNGNVITTPVSDLIQLDLNTEADNGYQWIVDDETTTAEQVTLYLNQQLEGSQDDNGEISIPFMNGFTIDGAIADTVKDVDTTVIGDTITTTYSFNGMKACIEANVYAVQQHNFLEAILSAWGKYINGIG